jgi:O-antigen ligase
VVLLQPDIGSILAKSWEDRLFFLEVSRGTIVENMFLGVGQSNFVFHVEQSIGYLEFWQYQPVHNVFLLIWAELGIFALFLAIIFIAQILAKIYRYQEKWSTLTPRDVPRLPRRMFHVEHSFWGGIFSPAWNILSFFTAIFLGLLLIMLFDHYLWDIQQGQIMLWLTLGIIVGYLPRD